ncbi:hypothetical protein SAMN05660653_03156 [Desulfonatronum thiosulfatophilum]|uniref:Uncharacterized protein n=1 Tax=Desulfonatronum thiosulfatophilum TaxID=617002 RepID=A0A1G6EUC2_9BACT|nr:hypothetical protein [Desulfonatronum thiosulfatophilum]SDB60993.1 hypothetical protein SAMN05660653_03156 [Desulfonatronum thiosulfatophilum]
MFIMTDNDCVAKAMSHIIKNCGANPFQIRNPIAFTSEDYVQVYGLLLDVIEEHSRNVAYLIENSIYFKPKIGMLPYLSKDEGFYWKLRHAIQSLFDCDKRYFQFAENVMIAACLRHDLRLEELQKVFNVESVVSKIATLDRRSSLRSGFLELQGERNGQYVALCGLCQSYCEVSRDDIRSGIRAACETCLPVFDAKKALQRAETCYHSRQEAEFKKAHKWANVHYLEMMRKKPSSARFFDEQTRETFIKKATAIKQTQLARMNERFRFNSLTHALKYLGLPLFEDAEIHRIGHEIFDVPNGPEVVPYGPISTIWKSQQDNRSLKKTNIRIFHDGRVFPALADACRHVFGKDWKKVAGKLRGRCFRDPDLTHQAAFNAYLSEIK